MNSVASTYFIPVSSSEKSSTSTVQNMYNSPFPFTEGGTPLLSWEQRTATTSPKEVRNITIINIEDSLRELISSNYPRIATEISNKNWSTVCDELSKVKEPFKNTMYSKIAKIATEIALEEIEKNKNESKPFHSPTAIKSYVFANAILNPEIKKETFEYIDARFTEEDEYFGEVTSTGDSSCSKSAEEEALKNNWGLAKTYLNEIQDPFFKDMTLGNLARIAANAAIEVSNNKNAYRTTALKAHQFCQEVQDLEYQQEVRGIVNYILKNKTKIF